MSKKDAALLFIVCRFPSGISLSAAMPGRRSVSQQVLPEDIVESPATGDPRLLSFEPGAKGTLVRWRAVEGRVRAIWRRHRTWLFVAYSRSLNAKTNAVERLLAAMDLEKAA